MCGDTTHEGDVTCSRKMAFVFERGENLLQNDVFHFVFRFFADKKLTFLKRAWHLTL